MTALAVSAAISSTLARAFDLVAAMRRN